MNWTDLRPAERFRVTLEIAVAAALLGGLVRSAMAAWRWAFTDRISFLMRDIVWMAPLGTLLVFAVPAVVLALLAARAPRFVTLRSAIFVIVVPAALSALLLIGGLHDAAALLLALGIAWRLADWGAAAPGRTLRLAHRAAPALAILVGAVGVGLRAGRRVQEARAQARLPAAAPGAPNLVLIVLDAVRAGNLSVYGYPRRTTPGLERVAADGALFRWAIAPSSWTLPSHAALFTGRFPGELSIGFRRGMGQRFPTLAEVLRAHGYATAGFAANPNYTTRESGLARGFIHYTAAHPSLREIVLSAALMQTATARRIAEAGSWTEALQALALPRLYLMPNLRHDEAPAELEVRRFLDWQQRIGARPFFAFLNLFDAHAPYLPPEPWRSMFAPVPGPEDRYDGAIAYQDAQVDTLLGTLQQRGVLNRTVVIVTSDHGELFGEHGLQFHNNSLYMELLHVPLLVRYPPRVPAGTQVDQPVALRRLGNTVLDLLDIRDSSLGGRSLAGIFQGGGDSLPVRVQMQTPEALARFIPASRGPMRAVVDIRWHYIREGDGTELLFAYRSDPHERRNLAHTEEGEAALPRLRELAGTLPPQP